MLTYVSGIFLLVISFISCTPKNGDAIVISSVDTFLNGPVIFRKITNPGQNSSKIEVLKNNQWISNIDAIPNTGRTEHRFDFDGDGNKDLAVHSGAETDIYFYEASNKLFKKESLHFHEMEVIDSAKHLYCENSLTVLDFNSSYLFRLENQQKKVWYRLTVADQQASSQSTRLCLYRVAGAKENVLIEQFHTGKNKYNFPYTNYWRSVLKKYRY